MRSTAAQHIATFFLILCSMLLGWALLRAATLSRACCALRRSFCMMVLGCLAATLARALLALPLMRCSIDLGFAGEEGAALYDPLYPPPLLYAPYLDWPASNLYVLDEPGRVGDDLPCFPLESGQHTC